MPQILPIKDLQDTAFISEMCHKADEPIYITKNGYSDMVLMSIELYEATQKKWSMYSDIELSEQQIKGGKTKDAKKALLDEALALENLSPKVRTMIQAERKKLDPPKNVSYERVRIPTSLQGGSKSRYGVNMSELLKGGTEDPWAKQK